MTIDLSQYVDEDVYITLRRGIKQTGCVVPSKSFNSYWVAGLLFCKDGKRSTEHINDNDIIHIELVQKPMTKYEQLEQQIKELQNEVDRLKKEEEKNKLPKGFDRKRALLCIKTQYRHDLNFFDWSSTSQGYDYWANIYYNRTSFTNAAIMQLQEWVIMSYQQEFEGK